MTNYVTKQDDKGNKEVVWLNTSLHTPTKAEIDRTVKIEFPNVTDGENLYFLAGIMRLTIKEKPSIL